MARTPVSDEVWEEFHTVVNMTSRELEEWLRLESAGEETESLPDQAGPPSGRHVVNILAKRRADLTEEDIDVMEAVIGAVRAERGEDLEPVAGDDAWRHRLMDLGHDPLKPA